MRDFAVLLPAGVWLICLLAVVSCCFIGGQPGESAAGFSLWTFARPHYAMYVPVAERWNASRRPHLNVYQLSLDALEQRALSGFLSGTPVADLIEMERSRVGGAFSGPLEAVGFLDLTEHIQSEGLLEELNEPSFSPWTSRGRIFGLPHDVHPVMLCYRADIVEAAGIHMGDIETWTDFSRVLQPLLADNDRDGKPDRYLLNFWPQQLDVMEALVLQAGGAFFDEQENVVIHSAVNARVISQIVAWCVGPDRIAIDAEEFTPSGNRLKLEGRVIASIMPDWLAGVWKSDMPELAGKLKLMPLPAWEPGGRRTSVWGGSMLGIARSTSDPEAAWDLAKYLYLSRDVARELYVTNGIISPVKKYWQEDFYRDADSFFCGQSPGQAYIALAPEVPRRTSSPFNRFARERVRDVVVGLRDYAIAHEAYAVDDLLEEADRRLKRVQAAVQKVVDRNVFLRSGS